MWKNGKETTECINRDRNSIPRGIEPSTQVLDLRGNNLRILSNKVTFTNKGADREGPKGGTGLPFLEQQEEVCSQQTNIQSRFAKVVLDATSAPSATHLRASLYLCSSGSDVRVESRALERRYVCSKSSFRVQDKGVAGRNGCE